jgi:hypothetical protein
VLVFKLGDRARRGGDGGRRDRLEEGVRDGAVEPRAAERLARPLRCVQVEAAHAGIARDAPVATRIRHLHPPAAAPAAHEALEQRHPSPAAPPPTPRGLTFARSRSRVVTYSCQET